MPVGNEKDILYREIKSDMAKDAAIKVLVSPKEGWEGYVMRMIEVQKDGYTPKHSHPWPHINFIVRGIGELMIDGVVQTVTAGSYAYVPANLLHQFKNASDEVFEFICIVPEIGHQY